jgi:hypothetical protein
MPSDAYYVGPVEFDEREYPSSELLHVLHDAVCSHLHYANSPVKLDASALLAMGFVFEALLASHAHQHEE